MKVLILNAFLLTTGIILSHPAKAIINGEKVPTSYFKNAVASIDLGVEGCSATLIGSQTILTAGHCAENNDNEDAYVYINKEEYTFRYVKNELFSSSDVNSRLYDYAIGVLAEKVPEAVAHPARLSFKQVSAGDAVTMAGYGCRSPGPHETFQDHPELAPPQWHNGEVVKGAATISRLNAKGLIYIFSVNTAAACAGDSGGPLLTPEIKNGISVWSVRGILSQGGPYTEKGVLTDFSGYAPITTPEFKTYLDAAIKSNHLEICGVNSECSS